MQVNPHIFVPRTEFEFRFDRSSGPGGQNVNKVNTKATLHWAVEETDSLPEAVRRRFVKEFSNRINKDGQLVISSDRYRDQSKNIDDCLQRVRAMILQVATPPKRRKKTKPSLASKRRRLEQKKRRAKTKELRKRID